MVDGLVSKKSVSSHRINISVQVSVYVKNSNKIKNIKIYKM